MGPARELIADPEDRRPPSRPKDNSQQDRPAADGRRHRVLRALGLGLMTGAADDDCSVIGTYAAAGAKVGPAILWTAPVTFPVMFAVVYLSAELGQVALAGVDPDLQRLLQDVIVDQGHRTTSAAAAALDALARNPVGPARTRYAPEHGRNVNHRRSATAA